MIIFTLILEINSSYKNGEIDFVCRYHRDDF